MFTVTCRELLLSSSERSYVSLELGVQTNELKRSGWFGRAQLGITQFDTIRLRTLRISEILYCLTKQETIGHILKMAKVTWLKSSPQLHTNSSRARELIFPKDINAYLSADQPPLPTFPPLLTKPSKNRASTAGIVTRIHTYVYALNIAPIYMRENFACIAKYV